MKTTHQKMFSVLGVLALVTMISSVSAHAETKWQKKHPRRTEVKKRLENQQDRVDKGLANGSLKPGQSEKIQNQDARIRSQEQKDAAQNGGHITKGEQKQLNREENHVSREINRDEKRNTAAPAGGVAPASVPAQSQ